MVLPTEAAFGVAATNLMQSTLDSIEERRRQDEEKAAGQKRDPVAEARITASTEAKRAQDKIAEALFGINNVDPNELKMQLTERLAVKLGIDLEQERSNYSLGKAIEEAVKELDLTQIAELEDELGLKDAGVTLATVIAAIKNPYGDDNARLMDGLSKIANGGKAGFDVERVLQRLEDVADPKTLEELKLGPQGYDPTRVEDAQTRAERQDDIKTLEASAKLEDVQDMQEAVEEHNHEAARSDKPDGSAAGTGTVEADMVLLLGATVEQVRNAEDVAESVPPQLPADSSNAGTPAGNETEVTATNAQAMEEMAADAADAERSEVLAVSVDEIGLYDFLKRKLAA